MAGYGVLLLALVVWVAPALTNLGPLLLPRSEGAAARDAGPGMRGGRPTISISIEPPVLLPYAEARPPVVFPGYLLPDDGCEEPAHAGS
jgi:hypothetical protein